jgi:hypothetical protein
VESKGERRRDAEEGSEFHRFVGFAEADQFLPAISALN